MLRASAEVGSSRSQTVYSLPAPPREENPSCEDESLVIAARSSRSPPPMIVGVVKAHAGRGQAEPAEGLRAAVTATGPMPPRSRRRRARRRVAPEPPTPSAIAISENPNGVFNTGYWIANSDGGRCHRDEHRHLRRQRRTRSRAVHGDDDGARRLRAPTTTRCSCVDGPDRQHRASSDTRSTASPSPPSHRRTTWP